MIGCDSVLEDMLSFLLFGLGAADERGRRIQQAG